MLVYFGICWYMLVYFGICWYMLVYVGIVYTWGGHARDIIPCKHDPKWPFHALCIGPLFPGLNTVEYG